jgi:hypothetical protein
MMCVQVAVKTVLQDANVDIQRKFLQEAAVMVQFRHRNVRRVIGVVHTPFQIPTVVRLRLCSPVS